MDGGHHADEEVERDRVPFLQRRGERFTANARHAHLAVGFIGEPIMQVIEQLTVKC